MYRKILVPLDGSGRAEAILPHVEELAHSFDAEVFFLQVIEPVYVYVDAHGYLVDMSVQDTKRESQKEEARTYLEGLAGEFREKGIRAKALLEEGSVVSTIIDVAEKVDADLIAMASHGRTGLSRVFYGSVTAGVLHRVDRPLLLIRAESGPD